MRHNSKCRQQHILMLHLKTVHHFSTCKADVFIDEVNNIYIAMPMYNLTEYSDNYSDTLRILWQF